MKKIATFLTIALIFSLCSTTAIAARHTNGKNFVDADGDGVCDNYDSNGNGCRKRSGCGNGYGKHSGCGKEYVDADGDGVCDNYDTNDNGCRKRSGCGKEYVDADGDGICDNMKYTIKYNLNGGKNNKKNPSSYCNTTKTIKLKNPTKIGYKFKGWYADKQCTKKVTGIKRGSSGQKTLYAKWKKITASKH